MNPRIEAKKMMAEILSKFHSLIAYVAAVHENQHDVVMLAWSSGAMAGCKMQEKPIDYSLDKMGLWGDAMREKKVIVTNDYKTTNRPSKHGYPEGHVDISRHMNGAIVSKGQVIGIVGVGNSSKDYSSEDEKAFGAYLKDLESQFLEMRDATFLEKEQAA